MKQEERSYLNRSLFPEKGEDFIIYIDIQNDLKYRWSLDRYVLVSSLIRESDITHEFIEKLLLKIKDITKIKRVFDLETATIKELETSYLLVDRSDFLEPKKHNISEILKIFSVFGIDENGDVYVKNKDDGASRNFYSFGEVSSGGIGGIGGSGSSVSILEKSQLGTLEEENLSQTFSAYAIDSIYKQVQELLEGGIGDYLTKDVADTYYAPLSYFDSDGVANKANFLNDKPRLGNNGNSIYVFAGGQQSLNFTVPYATKAGTADSVSKLSLTGSYTIFSQEFFKNGIPVSIPKGSTLSGIGSLIPHSSNNYDLGSTSSKWRTLYVSNISGLSTLSISGTLSVGGISTFTGKTTHNGGLEGTTGTFSSTLNVAGAATFGDTEENAIFFGSSGAKIWWDSENQCVRTNFNFAADGEVSSGGFGLDIKDNGIFEESLTIDTSALEKTVSLSLKANDIYAPLLLENGKGAYYLVPKDNGNFIGLALSTDSSASTASTTSNLVVRQLWAISSHSTNLPAICIGTNYTTKATFTYVKGTTNTPASVALDVALTHPSDITRKQILEDVCLSTEVIANAPLFKFTWKNSTDKALHIGTSAQYWLDYTPELTALYDGKYTLDYATLGVLMGKSNATEIEKLKAEVKELRLKVENYERMLNN